MTIRRRRLRRGPAAGASGWAESTLAEVSWDKSRTAGWRWSAGGALLGALLAGVAFAPAAWLARAVASGTGEHLLLGDARGTVWSGSAVPVLTGGIGSRDASTLTSRLEWTLAPHGLGVALRMRQACCLNGTVALQLRPGLRRVEATLLPPVSSANTASDWTALWPNRWLTGLGTPWNTLQLGGSLRLATPGMTVEVVDGRWRLQGRADVDLLAVSSRLSTLDTLGSYRLSVAADPASGPALLTLSTLEGALRLSGSGSWGPAGVRLRGEASAEPGDEAALANLLNIIGRRSGARSVISIG